MKSSPKGRSRASRLLVNGSSDYPMMHVLKLTSRRSAAVDLLREEEATVATQILAVAGFALLTAVGAHLRIYLWEVPVSLSTAAVYASGLYLGWRNGLLSQLLYIAAGMFLPVFSGDGIGLAYLLGAVSAGYVFAYPLTAAIVGILSRRWKTLAGSTLSALVGAVALFTCGVVWLHFAAGHTTWVESLDKGLVRFIPIDAAKIMLVTLAYAATRRFGAR